MSQHRVNGNINSFNTNIFNHVWNNCTAADERSEILAWLSPLEPRIRHQDIQTRRVDEVGDWVLQTREYRNWFGGVRGGESDDSALFCYGGPGVGKTYISSLVIDTLCKQAVGQNAAVACFYFDFAGQEEQSPAAVLGSVLKQIVGGLDEIPERIVKAFRNREKVIGGQRLVLAEIVEVLQVISSSRSTFICIDALDECPAGHRVKLLDSLKQILQKSPGARIFLTGRPHIRGEVEKHLGGRAATRSITPTKDDIIIFLRVKLKEDTIPDAMDQSLEEEIIRSIPETVSEIFLLVFLSVEMILQETTVYRRRQKLRAMKDGLDLGGAYKATLGRIKAQEGDRARLGIAALMWISHSRRPLRVDEICHALAIEIGSTGLNSDDIPAISTLIGCCQGLVTVDKGASTVRLIHFTLQEYLCTHPDLFGGAHSTMAEVSLTYLNFQSIKDLPAGPSPDPRDTPFLEYSLYWGAHARMGLSDRARKFALKLLDRFGDHISAEVLGNSIGQGFLMGFTPRRKSFSALHCVSYFGIAEVTSILIKMKKWDMNQRDSAGMTPLIWASRCGHEEVVGLLLRDKRIHPDEQDTNYGRTALSWAAENGHEGVVRLFLGPRFVNPGSIGRRWGKAPRVMGLLFGRRYVNPDNASKSGRTPLSWAAGNGHEGVVGLLLGREDVDPDILDTWCGKTPLSWAAENGCEGIVRLLLARGDVNSDNLDKYGRTPLSWAAENGHEGIAKLLLGQEGVNPDSLSGSGRTPLSWAAENGHEGIVEILLGREGVNPDRSSESGRTPLLWAARNGHEGIAKLLLRREDVNPDSSHKSGRTPLSWAAENGCDGIVKLLLGRADVNPDGSSESGRTPLSWAARNGHEGIAKLLLGREDVNPDSSDKTGRTPLSWAAENGYEGVVKLLLERADVNSDSPDKYGRTPLSWASGNGLEGTVKLLLGRGDVNLDRSSESGRTPLSWAAENGCEGIVKLLLGWGDVNPDSSDKYGRTPLSWAAEKGHEGMVKLLLGRQDVNPDSSSGSGRTPLSWAARNGHDGIVGILLGQEGVNPDRPDTIYGKTPLSRAAEHGCEGTMKLLLGREDVNPNSSSKSGRTPLSWAAGNGCEGIVRLLLGREDVDPDIPDTWYGKTPLSWAAENGREEVVKLLLRREDINPNCSSNSGRTPLSLAAGNRHEGTVKLLLARDGVKTDIPDHRGHTPRSWAVESGHDGIVKLLDARLAVGPGLF